MEMTQYQRDFVRMLDSMRDTSKGAISCIGIDADECEKCLLADICDNEILYNAEKVIEIVTGWAKEHPFVTNEQKYEETFGIRPVTADGHYYCPHIVGYECKYNLSIMDESVENVTCKECKEKFWQSEYKPPKVNKEGVSE